MSEMIEYVLHPAGQKSMQFRVSLNPLSETYSFPDPESAPKWTYLEENKCSHCPLSADTYKLCPLAERVVPFVEKLSHLSSIEKMQVEVTQSGRTRQMVAPVQDILGSLLGLFIATSDCPHTRFLRPMAHFHLPLANADETVYRVMSMYRLAQFFRKEQTGRAYAGFERLDVFYENMVEVNLQLSRRMRAALASREDRQDGTINAIVLLDALSQYIPASIETAIEDLQPIFNGYWDQVG